MIVLAVGLMVALQLFIGRTRLGRAMRSTAIDRDAAQLMGVDINTTIALTFFIGSALAGAAGVVQGLYFGITVFNIGFQAGLKAFTAAVLGGIGNTTGAALGGFVIGFLEVDQLRLGPGPLERGGRLRGAGPGPRLPTDGHPGPAAGRPRMSGRSQAEAPAAGAGAGRQPARIAGRRGARRSGGWAATWAATSR